MLLIGRAEATLGKFRGRGGNSWPSGSWTAAEPCRGRPAKKAACICAEDLIQGPKANGRLRRFGRRCGNLPHLRCKFPPRAERAGETGVRGSVLLRAGVKLLNDNTGCIELLLAQSAPVRSNPVQSLLSSTLRNSRESIFQCMLGKYYRSAKVNINTSFIL